MKRAIDELLEHAVTMASALPPSSVAELAAKVTRLSGPKESGTLIAGAATRQSQNLLAQLGERWLGAPEVDAKTMSHVLTTASLAVQKTAGAQSADLVWTGPQTEVVPVRRTEQVLLEIADSARKELLIVSFVAYKADKVVEALRSAVSRGILVRIVLEIGEEHGGKVTLDPVHAMRAAVPGADVFHWPLDQRTRSERGEYGSLHAKCAVSDDNVAFITSANLTGFALELNMELGILARGGSVPIRIYRHFDELIRRGVLVKLSRATLDDRTMG